MKNKLNKFYAMAAMPVAIALLSMNSALAAPTAEALSYTCAGCHGTDGSSVGPSSPHIAGMNKEYFIETMKVYQTDERDSTIMGRIARGYSAKQIEAMAGFFAAQELRLTSQQHDAAKAKLGATLHEDYCEKCHEDGGQASDSGRLAGQWMPYLEYSMDDYQSGVRTMTRKMKKKVDSMIKKEGASSVDAVIHYYASQK